MSLLRISKAEPLPKYRLRLTLTDGSTIERSVLSLMDGPVFEAIRQDPRLFDEVRIDGGTVCWPNGADLCPDVLIWNGLPPGDSQVKPPTTLTY